MKIVLSGVETNNKGAELMLYAILQEIERKWPKAKVYLPYDRCYQGLGYIKTKVDFRFTPYKRLYKRYHVPGILRHLHLSQNLYYKTDIVGDADWFIDGSGFAFSDQWNISDETINRWECLLEHLYRHGCKIVFLPQAFGPVELRNTKRILSVLNHYADIIIPREKISFDYLRKSGIVNMSKVKTYTDFTSLVEGVFPKEYEHLKDAVCVIPNMRMIDKGTISFDNYLSLLTKIVDYAKKKGRVAYLLNHEGLLDEKLSYMCKEALGDDISVVTGLNALEVKGLISSAYLVVSSRFHGVASALNSCVPCLATSWSHKYKELFSDYKLSDCILPLDNVDQCLSMVDKYLNKSQNEGLRIHLSKQLPSIHAETRKMWNDIWNQ